MTISPTNLEAISSFLWIPFHEWLSIRSRQIDLPRIIITWWFKELSSFDSRIKSWTRTSIRKIFSSWPYLLVATARHSAAFYIRKGVRTYARNSVCHSNPLLTRRRFITENERSRYFRLKIGCNSPSNCTTWLLYYIQKVTTAAWKNISMSWTE